MVGPPTIPSLLLVMHTEGLMPPGIVKVFLINK
jgi:hypothetical protein